MHHHLNVQVAYINFEQNRVCRSVITVHTNVFAKKIVRFINLQLPIEDFKNYLFQTWLIVKRTCISIFSKIRLVDQSKLCTQIYLQKLANCINLQLAIRISKNHAYRTCTTPSRTFRPILRSIGPLDNELPRNKKLFPQTTDGRHDGQTDGTTDGRTDVAHDNNRYFFFEKKNTKKYSWWSERGLISIPLV